jgi:outer membrane protein assembly factor BamD
MAVFRGIAAALILTLGSSYWFSGCSSAPVGDNEPERLYKDAEDDIQSDHFQLAVEKLKTIRNKFPYSSFATEAQLKIADVYFLQESYAEAALAYEAFRDLHPKHPKVPYAMFKTAKSYFNDAPGTVARDLTTVQKALDAYNDFLKKFPEAPEAKEAKQDVVEARRLLSEKELYVGNFYFKRDFYDSAKPRYKKILDLYPETAAAKEAKEKILKIEEYQAKHTRQQAPPAGS